VVVTGPGGPRDLADVVHEAQVDAWEVQGRIRAASGGGAAHAPGVRLMAGGLPHPQYNTADVTDPSLVDLDAVARWYAALGLPWGLRVRAGTAWSHGRHVASLRLMGRWAGDLPAAPTAAGVRIRVATPADLDVVARVDAVAYEGDEAGARAWLAPLVAAEEATVVLAEDDAGPVGTAYAVRSAGRAGPAVLLAGVAVVPRARRRGIGAALSTWLVADGYDRGAAVAHLQPDDDRAARVYARLGFVEVEGLDVYVP
jgi:GNAT superfamily N-acetyltransferase